MDLKGTTSLDPKLKEAYEKVMGTSFTPAAPPAPQTPAAQQPNPVPAASIPNTQAPLQPPPVQPLHVTEEEQPQPAQPLPPTPPILTNNKPEPEMVASPQIFSDVNPFKEPAPVPGEVLANNGVANEKKSNKLVVAGLVIGGVVFFIIYAFIWIKVFGLI